MNHKLVATYARISKEKDDGFSIATQHDRIRDYAAQHGLTLLPEYAFSETFTGRVIDRPELAKVRQLMRTRAIYALIVYATDRLARDVGIANLLLAECFEYGVELHIVQWGGSVHDTPEDQLRFEFESVFSGHERRKIRERTMRGRRAKVEAGIYLGSGRSPYGYTIAGEKRETHLVIVEEQRQAVIMIFTLYAQGVGVLEICRRLEAEGIPAPGEAKATRTRSRPPGNWAWVTVYKILKDMTYIGRYAFYKRSDNPVYVDVPAMITDEVWNQAQARLAVGRQQSIRNAKYPYLMARRLTCSCGRAAHTTCNKHKERVILYYFCPSSKSHDAQAACGLPYFHADVVDYEAWQLLKELIRDPQTIKARLAQSQAVLERRNVEFRERLARIDAQIAKHKNKLAFLLDLAAEQYANLSATEAQRGDTRALYRQQAAAIEEMLADLYKNQQELAAHLETVTISDAYLDDWERLSEEYRDKLDSATPEQQRELVENRNLRGTLAVEDDVKVVYFHLYDHTFRRIIDTDFTSTMKGTARCAATA